MSRYFARQPERRRRGRSATSLSGPSLRALHARQNATESESSAAPSSSSEVSASASTSLDGTPSETPISEKVNVTTSSVGFETTSVDGSQTTGASTTRRQEPAPPTETPPRTSSPTASVRPSSQASSSTATTTSSVVDQTEEDDTSRTTSRTSTPARDDAASTRISTSPSPTRTPNQPSSPSVPTTNSLTGTSRPPPSSPITTTPGPTTTRPPPASTDSIEDLGPTTGPPDSVIPSVTTTRTSDQSTPIRSSESTTVESSTERGGDSSTEARLGGAETTTDTQSFNSQVLETTPPTITDSLPSSEVTDQTTSAALNPTNLAALGDESFFDNRGGVAAVFTAVALVLVAISMCTVWFCRRRRRRLPRFSFQGPHISNDTYRHEDMLPAMTQSGQFRSSYVDRYGLDDPSRRLVSSSQGSGVNRSSSTSSHNSGSASTSGHGHVHFGIAQTTDDVQYRGPFSDYHAIMPAHGEARNNFNGHSDRNDPFNDLLPEPPTALLVDISEGPHHALVGRQQPPSAESTPSIYPTSLPPVPEENGAGLAFYEQQTRRPLRILPPLPPSGPRPQPPTVVINPAANSVSLDRFGYDKKFDNPFSNPLDVVYETGTWWEPGYKGKGKQRADPLPQPLSPANSKFSEASAASSTIIAVSASTVSDQDGDSSDSSNADVKRNPFQNSFLGRSVSTKESFTRPARSPLRPTPPLNIHRLTTTDTQE